MKDFNREKLINNKFNNSTLIFRFFQPIYIVLFINLFLIYGCSALKKNEDLNICSSTLLPCLASTEQVLLITNKGKIKLELYGKLAPITVGNFVDFVEKGAYDKTIFNRVIRKPYPFIIRGGDNSLIKGESKFIDSKTGKIRYVPLEIKLKSNNLPTYGKEIDVSNKKIILNLSIKDLFYLWQELKMLILQVRSFIYH